MPRKPREEEPGATYHVTIHSVAEGEMVWTDRDRRALLGALAETVKRYGWKLLAVAVLDTHYHLLVTTPQPNLARGMQYLNGTYAQAFNRRNKRRGALFRERYRLKKVQSEAHLLLTIRYIALNGVEAGTADHPRRDRWNSYPGVVGSGPRWPFIARKDLLELFGSPEPERSLRRLVAFVEGARAERPL